MADWLAPVDVVANSPLGALSGPGTIDGFTLTGTTRILVRQQEDPIENGIYDVDTGGAWARSADFDTGTATVGQVVYVRGGTDNTGKVYAAAADAGFVIDTDPVAFTRTNLPKGVYDPTDYGAQTTATTDGSEPSDAAFVRMFEDMAPPGFGGPFPSVYIPPGARFTHYFFENDLHITRTCIFEGAGPVDSGTGTKLKFAKLKGVFTHAFNNSPDGGSSQGTIIRNMMLEGWFLGAERPENFEKWEDSTAYVDYTGTGGPSRVTPLSAASTDGTRQTLAYYYECVDGGTSGGTEPKWVDPLVTLEVDLSTVWEPDATYAMGSVVRPTTFINGVTFAPSTDTVGHATIPYAETRVTGGVGDEPTFAGPAGTYTNDTGPILFEWVAVNAAAKLVTDGTVVWARKMNCGIHAMTIGRIDNVYIVGFLNAGIGACAGLWADDAGYSPPSNVNGLVASNVQIQSCGVGVNMTGTDPNACSFYDLNIVFNQMYPDPQDPRRVGIIEDSFLGNRYVGVQMAGSGGAGVYVPKNTCSATFVGLYQESDCVENECHSASASFWGGATVGFTEDSIYYGALPYGWVGVVQSSTNGGGYDIRSTFHDQQNHAIYGFSTKDNNWGGYSMQYGAAALGRGYWVWDYAAWPSLAMTTSSAIEGYGHVMHIDGYLAGRSTADRRYTFESKYSVHYPQIKYGARTIGDRVVSNDFAVRGGFASRVVTMDGLNGGAWTYSSPFYDRSQTGPSAGAADMIEAPVNGVLYAFACVKAGDSAATFPTTAFNAALPDAVYRRCWASDYFEIGASCRPRANANLGYVYVVDSFVDPDLDHATGASEPIWSTAGATVTDGNIVWTRITDPEPDSVVVDNTCHWQCLGLLPQYSRTGYIPAEGNLLTTNDGLTTLDTLPIPEHAATHFIVTVTAFDDTNEDAKFWELECFCTDAGAGPSIIPTETATVLKDTGAGTTAWVAYFYLSGSNLLVLIVGENAKTIRWKSQLKMTETL